MNKPASLRTRKPVSTRLDYFVTEWLMPIAFIPIVLISLLLPSTGRAQTTSLSVYNGDFSIATNAASHGGVLGEFDGLYGSGTNGWSVDTNAVLGLLLSPTVAITSGASGNATATGLLSTTVLGNLVNNNFTIYNNNVTAGTASAGTNFVAGRIYTVTADFSSSTALNLGANLSSLDGLGLGIGLRSSGTNVATGFANTANLLNITVLGNSSGRITLTYLSQATDVGNSIGITLFAGQGATASLSALGNISFDNVTLSVTPIPEPAAWAALAGATVLGGTILRRRFAKPSPSA